MYIFHSYVLIFILKYRLGNISMKKWTLVEGEWLQMELSSKRSVFQNIHIFEILWC